MDGKGRWPNNVFVERLWKSVKYEEVYLKPYESVSAAQAGIATYAARALLVWSSDFPGGVPGAVMCAPD
jgi:hypothetical protein